MLFYVSEAQAQTLIDILEKTIFHEGMVDWADYKEDEYGGKIRIERPDLVKASKDRVKLCTGLISDIKAVL